MTDHQLGVARVAAAAFLESDWSSPAALTVPASDAIGVSRRRLTAIATDVHATYQHPPRDRPRELATFIAAQETFTKLWRRGKPPHITRYPLPSVEMAHNHWHVRDLDTVRHLSDWLALPLPQLEFMADVRSLERSVDIRLRHYDHTWVHSRRGRVRLLERPRPRMRALQRRLLREILDQIPTHDAAHGFVQHRSVGTFAAPHAGRDVVVRMDLESFFATVTAGRVFGVFRLAGYAEPVAHLMAGLTTTVTPFGVRRAAPQALRDEDLDGRRRLLNRLGHPHLPQGSPSSPALANLVAYALDRRIAALAQSAGASYTRYADDLALSLDGPGAWRRAHRLVTAVREIATETGFGVNERKTVVASRGQRQLLCGVVVNDRPTVSRVDYDRLRALLHNCATRGPASQNHDDRPDFRAHLLGRIAWVGSLDPLRGARLRAQFDAIDW
ncbi:MAG TPA: reverse transcriptase family protein [Mycobacteriales bacterium]|nr:reverse transcriptase family protein [Mycobacteriales bacterium]